MPPEQSQILSMLRKFQWCNWKHDVCRLRFAELFGFLSDDQRSTLLQACELDESELKSLDATVPAKEALCSPYRFDIYSRRFVRVDPMLWKAFKRLSSDYQKAAGQSLVIISGYRSPAYQSMLYVNELQKHNFDARATRRVIMLPGKSEHQSNSRAAIDIANRGREKSLSDSSYRWLVSHAEQYGFFISYPKTTSHKSMEFEPWHWHFLLKQ